MIKEQTQDPGTSNPKSSVDLAESNPTHIWAEPTSRCNTRCKHCGHWADDFGDDMPESVFDKILNSALDNVEVIDLQGFGEPLIAPNFWTMFDECVRRGVQISMTTNGILLRSEELTAKIVEGGVWVRLSIDGAHQETFEAVRPFIKWERMLEVLECIKRHAEKAGPNRKFKLLFNFCAMKHNIGDLPDLVRLAARFGAEEIIILPLGGEEEIPSFNGQSLHASPEVVSPVLLEALRLSVQLGVGINVPSSFRQMILDGRERGRGLRGRAMRLWRLARLGKNRFVSKGFRGALSRLRKNRDEVQSKVGPGVCMMPWSDTYFATDGTVFPCCTVPAPLGDLKSQSWDEIWNGSLYRNLRRTMHSWNPTVGCRHCSLASGLNGGDERQYQKFFDRFQVEAIALDSEGVDFEDGFSIMEYDEDGNPSHCWMSQRGTLSLPMRRGARFLRFQIFPLAPTSELNPGQCQVNGGPVEPFDNTCQDISFPLDHVKDQRITATLEMERNFSIEGDERELALGIRGIQYLQ